METIEVSVKLPKRILATIKIREKDLEPLLRQVLATDLYRRGEISLGKAAEIAGISTKWEMMQLFAKHEIPIDYTAEDAEHDLKTLEEVLTK